MHGKNSCGMEIVLMEMIFLRISQHAGMPSAALFCVRVCMMTLLMAFNPHVF